MRWKDIQQIQLSKCGMGWKCRVWLNISVSDSFCAELHMTDTCRKNIFASIFVGLREAYRLNRLICAKPGEREANGWVEIV